ncbi:MAG: hydrogenase iron-sulfur subunit [Desulfobacterales bacterium]|nr:hydrogenase iron-sulfur subunit [Desulfobacterales bacterium]
MIKPVLVIGNGTCAVAISETLLQTGIDVIRVSHNANPDTALWCEPKPRPHKIPEVYTAATVVGCSGTVGKFKVRLQSNQQRIDRTVSAIIIAEENRFKANFSLYGLAPGQSILSLTQFNHLVSSASPETDKIKSAIRIVFLSGLILESHPILSEKTMRLCLYLQSEHNIQTYVLAGNLKVAGPGLEDLYWQSKKAGTVYVKFTCDPPQITRTNGSAAFVFTDEITGHCCELTPDVTVVDEMVFPSEHLAHLAEVLKIDRGTEGYVQTDNVRRNRIWTNRKGILAVGPSRGICTETDSLAEAEGAALVVMQLAAAAVDESNDHAVIDPGKCIHCLTCYRLCPHGAVTIDRRPAVAPESCENCGLCAAECPRRAIGASGSGLLNPTGKPLPESGDDAFEPYLIALCCSRSAVPAGKLSRLWGRPHPRQLSVITVPCGAGISNDLIYQLFLQGADGVLILTCHQGNCHSEQGHQHAYDRAAHIKEFFQQIGFEEDRLFVDTIAANMGAEFSERVAFFAETIRKLGPSRLRTC